VVLNGRKSFDVIVELKGKFSSNRTERISYKDCLFVFPFHLAFWPSTERTWIAVVIQMFKQCYQLQLPCQLLTLIIIETNYVNHAKSVRIRQDGTKQYWTRQRYRRRRFHRPLLQHKIESQWGNLLVLSIWTKALKLMNLFCVVCSGRVLMWRNHFC